MSWLGTILKVAAAAIGNFLLALLAISKKPKKVHIVGGDKETRDANDDAIRDAFDVLDDE